MVQVMTAVKKAMGFSAEKRNAAGPMIRTGSATMLLRSHVREAGGRAGGFGLPGIGMDSPAWCIEGDEARQDGSALHMTT